MITYMGKNINQSSLNFINIVKIDNNIYIFAKSSLQFFSILKRQPFVIQNFNDATYMGKISLRKENFLCIILV